MADMAILHCHPGPGTLGIPQKTPPALKGAGHGKRDIDTSDSESVHIGESVLNRKQAGKTPRSPSNIFEVGWFGQTHL